MISMQHVHNSVNYKEFIPQTHLSSTHPRRHLESRWLPEEEVKIIPLSTAGEPGLSSSSPRWLETTLIHVAELLNLRQGWDGHNGSPIRPDAAMFALSVLESILQPKTPAPQVIPLSNGGLQFEWHENGVDLEIEISAPYKLFASYENTTTGARSERELSSELGILNEPIRQLTGQ